MCLSIISQSPLKIQILFLFVVVVGLPLPVAGQDGWNQINSCVLNRSGVDSKKKITAIAFVDEKHGVLGGSSGFVRYTRNGGISWQKSAFDPPFSNIGITDDVQRIVVNETTIYLVCYKRVFRSQDGGARWSLVNTPPPAGYRILGASTTVFFYDGAFVENRGWILGAAYDSTGSKFLGAFVVFLDLHEERPKPPQVDKLPVNDASNEMLQISFSDRDHGWIVGQKGSILSTDDGGNNWTVQRNLPHQMSVEAISNVSATGSPDSPAPDLYGVYFQDKRKGWIVGNRATILFTNDGGDTWLPARVQGTLPGDNQTTFTQVQFINNDVGWIVGKNGNILRSSDGGETWVPQFSGTSQVLYTIAMDGETSGWAAGAADTLLRYDAMPSTQMQPRTKGGKRRGDRL
jgi:photosystem II stability/assembly factor-like uncharacterized protein